MKTRNCITENAINKIERQIKTQKENFRASVVEIRKRQNSTGCLRRAVHAPDHSTKQFTQEEGIHPGGVKMVNVNLDSLTFQKGRW